MTSDATPPPDGPDPMETGVPAGAAPGHIEDWESEAIDLLEGNLDPETAALLEAHLAACDECREGFEQQRAMAALFQGAPLIAVPPVIEAAVFEALETAPEAATIAVPAPMPAGPGPIVPPPGPGILERLRSSFTPRVWLPAAAMVLIAGVAISSYYRSGLDDARDSSAVMADEKTSSDGAVQEGAPSSAGEETAAPTASTSTTTSVAALGGDSSSPIPASPETTTTYSSDAEATGAMLEELDSRLDVLTARATPGSFPVAWLSLDVPTGDGGAAAALVESITSLLPLTPEAWVDGVPTFAALASPDDIHGVAGALGVDLAWATSASAALRAAPAALTDLISDPARLPELKIQLADVTSGLPNWEQVDPLADITAGQELAVMILMLQEAVPIPAE
jgi:hypothetical protein